MLNFVPVTADDIAKILAIADRNQMAMNEYPNLADDDVRENLSNRLHSSLLNEAYFSFAILDDERFVGYIECSEDSFDSEHFGMRCFRIIDLILTKGQKSSGTEISSFAIKSLTKHLVEKFGSGYLFASLSNNHTHLQDVFNSYCSSGFNFIHTLLTFSQIKSVNSKSYTADTILADSVLIREAKLDDLPYLEDIALKSFKYSRFHMDDLLDNDKASNLLKQSVRNSLIDGFADVIFVAEMNNIPVGYYSARKRFNKQFNLTIGEATISAVSSSARGKGVFRLLNAAMLDWFEKNTDIAEMGTYMINSPIHRTWISNNLRLIRGTHQFSRLF